MNMKVKNEIITEIAKPQQLMLTKKKTKWSSSSLN